LISGNSAVLRGGGIQSSGNGGGITLTLDDSILADNTAPTGPDLREDAGGAATTLLGKNLISDTTGNNGLTPASALIVGPASLAPLGNYGGPLQTMHLLAGSLAIDAGGTVNPGGTDQRGFPRFVNGNLDIGAVETGPIHLVNKTGDGAATATTLRKAITDATAPGAVIQFDPNIFNGQAIDIISLSNGQLAIDSSVTIDASNISGGVIVDANGNSRVLEIMPGRTVSIHGLTLTGGFASGAGGAVSSTNATLSLHRCLVSGNNATSHGGGFFQSGGTSMLTACTFTENTTPSDGGALYIQDSGICNLINTTLSGNSSTNSGEGGGIMAFTGARLHLLHTTVASNSAGSGGGIQQGLPDVVVTLENSIVAGNTGGSSPDISGLVDSHSGLNFIGDPTGATGLGTLGTDYLTGDPFLAALGSNGGPVPTMHPQIGSPTIDPPGAATTSTLPTDARGYPRVVGGKADIGAVETGPVFLVNSIGDGAATATTLRKAIGDATALGSLIQFDPTVFDGQPTATITLSNGQLTIDSSVTIDASNITGGVTIDANDASRVLEIMPDHTVLLHALTLTGGFASGGFPAEHGGAIYNDRSVLRVTDCTISGNAATNGGGIYCNATTVNTNLFGSVSLTLEGSTLELNSATRNGGGIVNSGTAGRASMIISGCTFSENSAASSGGGVFNSRATLFANSSSFSGNSASFGGGIYNNGDSSSASLSLSGCTFSENSADFDGGGIYNSGSSGNATLSVDSCTLSNNFSDDEGGGIYSRSAILHVRASTLTGNSATRIGGGIHIQGNLSGSATTSVDSSILTGNSAPSGGGISNFAAGASATSTLSIESSTLTGNAATTQSGGGIYNQGTNSGSATVNVNSSILSGNSAQAGGGGIYNYGTFSGSATANVDFSTLSENSANAGGAIHCFEQSSGITILNVNSSALSRNSAGGGGGIYGLGSDGTIMLNVDSSTLTGNSAPFGDGGGIHFVGSTSGSAVLNVNFSTLSGNSAGSFGGGIHSDGKFSRSAAVHIASSTLSGNSAFGGGGIYSFGLQGSASLTLSACTVSGNSASEWGGGIYSVGIQGIATVSLENTILGDNASSEGPDLWESESTTTALGKNLISSVADSSLSPTDPALIIGAPNLAPLGDYGGPTSTMIPLPGSLALAAAGTTNPGGTDQRGFDRFVDGALDIGAVEFQIDEGLAPFWLTDTDLDGSLFGVEHALGTDPDTSDRGNPANLIAPQFNGSGNAGFTFGRNPAAEANTIWILQRSTTLAPGSFLEIFRFDGPAGILTNQPGITSTPGATMFSVTDTTPPAGQAFYRFKAVYVR
jgi:hypothetical protein